MNAPTADRGGAGYTIRLDGLLDPRWAAWFEGFTIATGPDGTTSLSGVVVDQAQLHSLLAKVRDLGITLISLEQVQGPVNESL